MIVLAAYCFNWEPKVIPLSPKSKEKLPDISGDGGIFIIIQNKNCQHDQIQLNLKGI